MPSETIVAATIPRKGRRMKSRTIYWHRSRRWQKQNLQTRPPAGTSKKRTKFWHLHTSRRRSRKNDLRHHKIDNKKITRKDLRHHRTMFRTSAGSARRRQHTLSMSKVPGWSGRGSSCLHISPNMGANHVSQRLNDAKAERSKIAECGMTLEGPVARWHSNHLPGSITTFDNLKTKFLRCHEENRPNAESAKQGVWTGPTLFHTN